MPQLLKKTLDSIIISGRDAVKKEANPTVKSLKSRSKIFVNLSVKSYNFFTVNINKPVKALELKICT